MFAVYFGLAVALGALGYLAFVCWDEWRDGAGR